MITPYIEFEGASEDQINNVCKKLGLDSSSLTTLDVSSIYDLYGIDFNKIPLVCLEEDRKTKVYVAEKENI